VSVTIWRGATLPRGRSGVQRLRQAEKDWQKQVLKLAAWRGWIAYHTYDSRRSTAGFPDLVLARPPRVIFAELKTETGIVDPAQRAWLDVLGRCSVECYCWRPSDWDVLDAILT